MNSGNMGHRMHAILSVFPHGATLTTRQVWLLLPDRYIRQLANISNSLGRLVRHGEIRPIADTHPSIWYRP